MPFTMIGRVQSKWNLSVLAGVISERVRWMFRATVDSGIAQLHVVHA
jgi:hypothetical protein